MLKASSSTSFLVHFLERASLFQPCSLGDSARRAVCLRWSLSPCCRAGGELASAGPLAWLGGSGTGKDGEDTEDLPCPADTALWFPALESRGRARPAGGDERSSLGGAAAASTALATGCSPGNPPATEEPPRASRDVPCPSPAPGALPERSRRLHTAGAPRRGVTLKLEGSKQDLFLNKVVLQSILLSVIFSIVLSESANQCSPVSL